MATTNYLPWNPSVVNQEDDPTYLADTLRSGGAAVDDIFGSALANKLFYQLAQMANALAQVAVAYGISVSDADLTVLTKSMAALWRTGIWCGTSGGSGNAQTLSPAVAITAYYPGMAFRFIAGFTNTAAATINVDGVGALAVMKPGPTGPVALTGGEIIAGNELTVAYDGTQLQIQGGSIPVDPAVNTVYQKQLNADVTIPANTNQSVLSQAVTMPASGGPWRVLVSYSVYTSEADFDNGMNGVAWVSDGTNVIAMTQEDFDRPSSSNGNSGIRCSEMSFPTYANGASVTFTLFMRQDKTGVFKAKSLPAIGPSQKSFLSLAILPTS